MYYSPRILTTLLCTGCFACTTLWSHSVWHDISSGFSDVVHDVEHAAVVVVHVAHDVESDVVSGAKTVGSAVAHVGVAIVRDTPGLADQLGRNLQSAMQAIGNEVPIESVESMTKRMGTSAIKFTHSGGAIDYIVAAATRAGLVVYTAAGNKIDIGKDLASAAQDLAARRPGAAAQELEQAAIDSTTKDQAIYHLVQGAFTGNVGETEASGQDLAGESVLNKATDGLAGKISVVPGV